MIIKLERCPFCGSLAGYSKVPQQGFTVVCRSCGAIAMHDEYMGRDDIAKEWNRRVKKVAFSNSRIRPCPFCGTQIPSGGFSGGGSIICCPGCGMMVSFAGSHSIHTTITLWNDRV
ncbi:Lar family restriction alleviation protein [Ruminococcaceae bacterium OttesenSCG-928-I18]|nr:Lar family restriction alleviation protein [Ruminococcaceae bacterium OttesenSCG-928-I18]